MTSALDLLMDSDSTAETTTLLESNGICTIDSRTRTIFVPPEIVVGAVQSDKNAERIKFSCPKIVGDNLDLSKFSIRINFENVSSVDPDISIKDQYICEDASVNEDNIIFSWVIGKNAARYMGTIRFIVCAVKTDSDSNISIEWNTTVAQIPVLEGIEVDQPSLDENNKDVINQLLAITKTASDEAVKNVNSAKEQAITDIQNVSQPDKTLTVEGGIADAKATGNAISSLREDMTVIDSRMTPIVKYTNWFDKTKDVTVGYFLNYTNGSPTENASYGYSDFYPIKKNTKYYANGFGSGAQFCFYDLSKKFISGVLLNTGAGAFTTPNNCVYIRYSVYLKLLSNLITVVEGDSIGEYTPYEFLGYETIKSRILEVGNKYPYKSIMSAVNDAIDNDIIFIHSGIYDGEVIDASIKTLSIIGEDRDRVIIKNDFGTYTKPPLKMGSGLLRNVTLIAVDAGKPSEDADGTRPYALHCDYDILAGKTFRVENCIMRSWLSSGVGFGLRKNGKMSFDNCVIESKTQRVALFGHDSPKSSFAGTQYLSIKDCIIDSSYNYAVRFDSQRIQDANIYLTLINNTVVDSNATPNSAYNNSGTGQATTYYNFNNLIGYHNDKKSHGNTLDNWNYVN
nr:MAG TPA: PL-6 Lyase Family 6 [Caudoviricetes sp.]